MRVLVILILATLMLFGGVGKGDMQTDAVLFADLRTMTVWITPPASYNDYFYIIYVSAEMNPGLPITTEMADRLRDAMWRALGEQETAFTAIISSGGAELQFSWDMEADAWIILRPFREEREQEIHPQIVLAVG